jgi:hypothetical protein
MACIHPYTLRVPEYRLQDGSVSPIIQNIPGVLALHYETKTSRPGVIMIFSDTAIILELKSINTENRTCP